MCSGFGGSSGFLGSGSIAFLGGDSCFLGSGSECVSINFFDSSFSLLRSFANLSTEGSGPITFSAVSDGFGRDFGSERGSSSTGLAGSVGSCSSSTGF